LTKLRNIKEKPGMSEQDAESRTVRAASTETAAEETIHLIAEKLDRWFLQLGRQFGPLSRPQRRALLLLASMSSMRVGDLAEQLGLTSAGATRMLDNLEAQEYATRARMPLADQREVYVALTDRGKEALTRANAAYFDRISASVARLTLEEQNALAGLLGAMLE
jgi:DNA-binding MarR family transcriptional regulator